MVNNGSNNKRIDNNNNTNNKPIIITMIIIGCHQCGSREWKNIFKISPSANTFIADHMPPTKFYNKINNQVWRKFLRMKVSKLYN